MSALKGLADPSKTASKCKGLADNHVMLKGWVPVFKVKVTVQDQTEFGIKVHHRTPECCVAILDCCLQGYNEGPNPQGIFVRTIFSQPLNSSS